MLNYETGREDGIKEGREQRDEEIIKKLNEIIHSSSEDVAEFKKLVVNLKEQMTNK